MQQFTPCSLPVQVWLQVLNCEVIFESDMAVFQHACSALRCTSLQPRQGSAYRVAGARQHSQGCQGMQEQSCSTAGQGLEPPAPCLASSPSTSGRRLQSQGLEGSPSLSSSASTGWQGLGLPPLCVGWHSLVSRHTHSSPGSLPRWVSRPQESPACCLTWLCSCHHVCRVCHTACCAASLHLLSLVPWAHAEVHKQPCRSPFLARHL